MDDIKIADIPLKGRVVLGPMAGVTNLAYREFMKPFGVALSYSEMISDCGLVYGNQKTNEYYKTSEVDQPIGLQLFGFDIDNAIKAIDILEERAHYDILDLNMGCPVPKVTRTGAGSAWMKREDELYEYVEKIVKHSKKPVTVKMRLGWDEKHINCIQIAKKLADMGVSMITIHARTAVQQYTGKPDFEKIRGLGKELPIPLCVSGDIFVVDDALKAMDITGANLVMVARGGLGNPELITNINRAINHEKPLETPSVSKDAEYALEYSKMLIAQAGERRGIMLLRGQLPHFFNGFPGYKKIRNELSVNLGSFSQLEKLLNGIINRNKL